MDSITRKKAAIRHEEIRFAADFQLKWKSLIQPLPAGKYTVTNAGELSIHGDAPKSFLRIKEYIEGTPSTRPKKWVGYIAKVGSKFYPNESITEHLVTRIGQACGVRIAESQLRMVGQQVRFLSKYFLRRGKNLVHGLEIFRRYLDAEFVAEVAARKWEQEIYTFRTVLAAVRSSFPGEDGERILSDFVEMLTFDALVGNNDRHPMNWGVVAPLSTKGRVRFSPIFDTARALFWNNSELKIERMLNDTKSLTAYTKRSVPQIGWDGCTGPNHFDLMGMIHANYPIYRTAIEKFTLRCPLDRCLDVVSDEFSTLMSRSRVTIIQECLKLRHKLLSVSCGQGEI